MALKVRPKIRPEIHPLADSGELSATFGRKLGSRARRKLSEHIADELPSPDEAVKASERTMLKMNLIDPSLRFIRDAANVGTIKKALLEVHSSMQEFINQLTNWEWATLVEAGMRFARQSFEGFVNNVKGRILELNLHYSENMVRLRKLCEQKVEEVVGQGKKWVKSVVVIKECYVIYRGRRLLFADLLFVTFDKAKNPTKVWIVGVGESKSEFNAIELVHRDVRPDDPESGEFLGQLHLRSEQMDIFEIEIPGYGTFKSGESLVYRTLRKGGSVESRWVKEDTIYAGVIPSDTAPDVKQKIRKELDNTNSLLLEHQNMTGKEAGDLARSFVKALPLLDELSK